MEIDLALLADAATIDGSGKLNILGVFDRISASAFPAQHGRMAMVLRFSAGLPEAGPHDVGIRLSGPDGQEVLRLDGEMQLAPGPRSAGGGVKVPHVLNLDGTVQKDSPWLGSTDQYKTSSRFNDAALQIEARAPTGSTLTMIYSRTPEGDLLEEAFINGRGAGRGVAKRQN